MTFMQALFLFLRLFREDAISGLIRPETLAAADQVQRMLRPRSLAA